MAGNDANTQLLLHCDGADNGTSFPDASQNALTATATGSCVTHTSSFAAPKFGSASMKLPTAGGLTLADTAALRPGAGDFTIDFWVRYNGGTLNMVIWDKGGTGANALLLRTDASASPKIQLWNNSAAFLTETAGSATGAWVHKAIVRSGTTITMYSGGVANGSVGVGATNFSDASGVGIGQRNGGTEPLNGNLDEFRLSNSARWTTGFTPPTTFYSADYSLVPATGSYALTGVALTMKRGLHLIPATGSYALTGTAIFLRKGYVMAAATGAYVITGIALEAFRVVADAGKNLIRQANYVLQRIRVTPPTLDQ